MERTGDATHFEVSYKRVWFLWFDGKSGLQVATCKQGPLFLSNSLNLILTPCLPAIARCQHVGTGSPVPLWLCDGETAMLLFQRLYCQQLNTSTSRCLEFPARIYSPRLENQSDEGEQNRKRKNKQPSLFFFFSNFFLLFSFHGTGSNYVKVILWPKYNNLTWLPMISRGFFRIRDIIN